MYDAISRPLMHPTRMCINEGRTFCTKTVRIATVFWREKAASADLSPFLRLRWCHHGAYDSSGGSHKALQVHRKYWLQRNISLTQSQALKWNCSPCLEEKQSLEEPLSSKLKQPQKHPNDAEHENSTINQFSDLVSNEWIKIWQFIWLLMLLSSPRFGQSLVVHSDSTTVEMAEPIHLLGTIPCTNDWRDDIKSQKECQWIHFMVRMAILYCRSAGQELKVKCINSFPFDNFPVRSGW